MNESFILRSGYDGLGISVMMTLPEGETSAVLQLAHGMRGHKERFLPLMEFLAMNGVACVANDHRGHGESVRSVHDRGYMYSGGYPALVDDMRVVNEWIHAHFPEKPVFLLGHSMGSMAARIYTKKYDSMLSGLIVCGTPGYVPSVRMFMLLTGLLGLFNHGRMRPAFIQDMASEWYNRRFAEEGKMAWVCSDPQERRELVENPLCNYTFTINGLHNLLGMMMNANSSKGWAMANPNLPVVFISGADDPCMGGEKKLHDAAKMMYVMGYHNVTAAIFTEMRHEILHEVGKEIVWKDVLDFINACA